MSLLSASKKVNVQLFFRWLFGFFGVVDKVYNIETLSRHNFTIWIISSLMRTLKEKEKRGEEGRMES